MMKDTSSNHSVVTDEVVGQQIETIAVDEYGRVDEISLDYNEYRNDLISSYKQSSSENSIISTYSIIDGICNHSLVVKNSSGLEIMNKVKRFNYNESFVNFFLIPMIEDYSRNNDTYDSVIEVLDGGKSNFILRTKLNDSLVLRGIDVELANRFKNLVTEKEITVNILNKKVINENGISNHLIIFLVMIAIGMVLVGVVMFSVTYYK